MGGNGPAVQMPKPNDACMYATCMSVVVAHPGEAHGGVGRLDATLGFTLATHYGAPPPQEAAGIRGGRKGEGEGGAVIVPQSRTTHRSRWQDPTRGRSKSPTPTPPHTYPPPTAPAGSMLPPTTTNNNGPCPGSPRCCCVLQPPPRCRAQARAWYDADEDEASPAHLRDAAGTAPAPAADAAAAAPAGAAGAEDDGGVDVAGGRGAGAGEEADGAQGAEEEEEEQRHVDPGSDSSEDERPNRNTVGEVPLEWYKDEDHVG